MTMNLETRHLTERPEFRSLDGGRKLVATGYAAVYNVLSKTFPNGLKERVLPSAFTKTLQETDVRAYQDHNHALFLGRTSSGTLRLRSDDYGLAYEIDLPDTTAGRDAAVLLERGDMIGSSFGFTTHRGSQRTKIEDGVAVRSLIDVGLHHVSPLTEIPAYDEATTALALRSMAASDESLDLNRLLAATDPFSLADAVQQRTGEDTSNDETDTDNTTRPDNLHPVRVRRNRRYS